jgi:peptidoglycan/LPS O-acetylase OafA/YrhL
MALANALADPPAARRAHLAALDGLRGVAILGVLAFHTGHLAGGFLGVDLFFALSGYLITALLLRELAATGSVSLFAFWGRRVRRLLPALAIVLAAVTVVACALGPADVARTALADGPWVQLDLVNWHLLAESASYWDRLGPGRPFQHLWSIAVEEQFYVAWPVVVLMVAWRGGHAEHRVAVLAAAGAMASLVLMAALVDAADPTRVYTGTDTRAFSLLLGAVVATAPVRDVLQRTVAQRAGVALGVLALGIGAAWFLVEGTQSAWLYDGGLFAHSLAAALLVALCVAAPTAPLPRALAWAPVRWLGLISYSLYLWHWPVIVLLSGPRLGLAGWPLTGAACAASIALAALSTRLVEDPIRFRAGWARGRAGLLAFAAVMAGLAALWLLSPGPAVPSVDTTDLR